MNYPKELQTVFDLMKENGGEARFVGGAVRDFILNGTKPFQSEDIDLAVNIAPESVASIFNQIKAKVITKYATNIVVIGKYVFEITSTRKDENADGRYATMIFTPSFEEDSNRRDLTINALYMNEKGQIFDYHGGEEDLKNGIVRFIGNPEFRIEEDYLRIWRFFRFSCLYGNDIDKAGFEAVIKKKDGLSRIAKERVTTEMVKLLGGKPEQICFILEKMIEAKVLSKDFFTLKKEMPSDAFLRLLFLTNVQEIPYFIYTREQKKFIKLYNEMRTFLKNEQDLYFFYKKTEKYMFQKILELGHFLGEVVQNLPDFTKLDTLPFSAQTIMAEGFEGAEISKQYDIKLKEFIKSF